MSASEVVVVAGPGAPADVAALVRDGRATSWESDRVEREGFVASGPRLVLLFVEGSADEQKRWLAALGRSCDRRAAIGVYAPRLSVSELAAAYPYPAHVVGFDFLEGGLAPDRLVEVAPGLRSAPWATQALEATFAGWGLATERVGDFAGLVLRRVLFMIINEAVYALWEGVASREDIDLAMRLGTGYPLGPLAWADAIGLDRVYEGLRGLHEEYGEDRYRPCPLLRKMAAAGLTGKCAGAGFYAYGAEG